MSDREQPRRGDYRVFYPVSTRWADNDIYGHVNNVVYYAWFDSAVNRYLIEEGAGSVAKVLDKAGKSMGAPVEITAFVRYQLGEESGSADAEAA